MIGILRSLGITVKGQVERNSCYLQKTMASMSEMSSVTVLRSAAAERNKNAIMEVLKQVLPDTPINALEIASGTGQHVVYNAEHLPNVKWQPSEVDPACLVRNIPLLMSESYINGHVQVTQRENVKEALAIDVTTPVEEWAEGNLIAKSYDLILCVNMVHISEWKASEGLFRGSGHYLKPGGMLVLYGPFKINGTITPESNVQFDKMLRQQNETWGLRDIDEMESLAKENSITYEKMIDMPANNKVLVFRADAS